MSTGTAGIRLLLSGISYLVVVCVVGKYGSGERGLPVGVNTVARELVLRIRAREKYLKGREVVPRVGAFFCCFLPHMAWRFEGNGGPLTAAVPATCRSCRNSRVPSF